LHGVPPFISKAVVQVAHIIWFQPYVRAGRGSLLEHVFLSAARSRRGVKVQSSEFRFSCTTYTITVCIRLCFLLLNSWYDLEIGEIYLPSGLEGANLVVY
jgi:hypothetical protein